MASSALTSASSKTFIIDHPTDKNKYLVHGCLEGPDVGVYYRGTSKISNNKFTEIQLPNYTQKFYDFTVQITPINDNEEESNINLSSSRVINGKFKVYGKNCEFFWLVHATRNKIEVEPLKSSVKVKGDGPYKYIVKE